MTNIQSLDIQFQVGCFTQHVSHCDVSTTRQKLFTLCKNLKELSLHIMGEYSFVREWLEEWVNLNCVPKKLNIILFRYTYVSYTLMCQTVSSFQSHLPMARSKSLPQFCDSSNAMLNFYFTTSSDLSLVVPRIQLQVANSSVILRFVKANKYGLLGLDLDTLHLTEGSYHGKKVYMALPIKVNNENIDTSITSLNHITYFDASWYETLNAGHLEQLSIACPNLQMLDLSRNRNCLTNLQGLHSLADNCKNLHALNLRHVYGEDRDYDCSQLWEILCTMKLTHLATEAWMVKISDTTLAPLSLKDCSVAMQQQKLTEMFQKYSSLKVLELGSCSQVTDNELLLLCHFPSIASYKLCNLPSDCHHAMRSIFSYKYLRCLILYDLPRTFPFSIEACSNLKQLHIHSKSTIPESFVNALCSHGGLEHVILCVISMTVQSIISIVEYSPYLMTFHVTLYHCEFRFKVDLKARFSKRMLFNGGSVDIKHECTGRNQYCKMEPHNTNFTSIWNYIDYTL